MASITKRIERVEERMGMGQAPIIIRVVWFGGEPVPPEERRDNIIIRYVAYESIRERSESPRG
jgi:sulfatase maturation enzyme AslB (radical SAM superfamily)